VARPQKQTVDYFPHYANSGKTIFILENKFGNNGYAFWFKLLELLASTDGHSFRTENSIDWEFLLAKTKVDDKTATEILNTLADLDAIDKELWDKKIIWVQKLVDNLEDVYKKRRVSAPEKPFCESFRSGNPLVIENDIVSDSENPQSKVKESKEKKTKGKESIGKDRKVGDEHDNNFEDEEDLTTNSPTLPYDLSLDLCKYYSSLKPAQSCMQYNQQLAELIQMYGYEETKAAMKTMASKTKIFALNYMASILQNKEKEKTEGSDIVEQSKGVDYSEGTEGLFIIEA